VGESLYASIVVVVLRSVLKGCMCRITPTRLPKQPSIIEALSRFTVEVRHT